MTNQETIANLNMIRIAFVEPVTKEQRKLIDDTFDNAIKALEQEPCGDMTTAYLMGYYAEKEPKTGHWIAKGKGDSFKKWNCSNCGMLIRNSQSPWYKYCPNCGAKMVEPQTEWIPVSERLPKDTYPVNITWVNHNPESYYADIKDKPFTATGHYCNGRWWWYSVTCQDYLDEYGRCDVDAMDDDIEVVAWMPLPKPYEPQERSEE